MKGKQFLYLFAALLLPVCIFIFLKLFGKNEFAVQPLYTTESPEISHGCDSVKLPYVLPSDVMTALDFKNDSLVAVVFGKLDKVGINQLKRVAEEFPNDPIRQINAEGDTTLRLAKDCLFFVKKTSAVVLVDARGRIRGIYDADDREDIDRMLTEITIILKKY